MATIKPRRGNGYPASGLVENELAIDTTNKRIYLGSAGGSGITVASFLTDYVISINGITGPIGNVARTNEGNTFSTQQVFSAGISASASSNTIQITSTTTGSIGLVVANDTNPAASASRVGRIQLGRAGTSNYNTILENSSGKFTIFNGATTGIPYLTVDSTGISFAANQLRIYSPVTIPEFPSSGLIRFIVDDGFSVFTLADLAPNLNQTANTVQTMPLKTGTLLNTASDYVAGICGATGAVNLHAGSNITITKSGNTFTFASTASGGGGFTYAASAPGTPSVGDRWIDSDTGKEFVYINDGDSSQWMEPVSSNGLTGVTYNSSTNTLQFNSTVVAPNLMSLTFTPLENQPPASNYATIDTRNGIMVLEFDATTDESATFVSIMPQTAILTNGLKIRINWMADTATTGTCRWGAQIERMNTDLDSDSFDTAATAGSTTNGTSGIITTTEITITTIDSVAVGEPFRLKIYRDADGTSGTDDMTGDAQLVSVEIRSVG